MNSFSYSDDILPNDLQDVLIIPLSDSGAFHAPIETCQTNWNNSYPNYCDKNLSAQSEGVSNSKPQNGAGYGYSPYTETPSSSSLWTQANYNNHIDELLLPEEDNSLRPAWSASGAASSSSFTMLREDAESSARSISRDENDGKLFSKWTDETDPHHSSSLHLRTGNCTLNNFNQIPSWDSPRPLSDHFQILSQDDLYCQNNETFSYDTQEYFSNNSSFLGGVSELSLDSVPSELVSEDWGSDGGQQIRRSMQKPRQRLTKEEYDRMTREQLEARRRDNMRGCSKEYRARKKQEQARNAGNYEKEMKLNEELNKKKHALEKQKHIMETSLERLSNKFR